MDQRLFSRDGTVVGCDDESVHIEFSALSGCSACAGGAGCGLAPVAGFVRGKCPDRLSVDRRGQPPVAVGDRVRVGIHGGRFLQLVSWTFALPLAAAIAGAVTVSAVMPQAGDAAALLGALSGGIAAVGLLQAATRRRPPAWLGMRITRLL